MKKVYRRSYLGNREISCWYGTPSRGQFEYDVIRLKLSKGDDVWLTPDEAAAVIRALSAGLHHWLVESDEMREIIDAKET
jgi:hypothetical protein